MARRSKAGRSGTRKRASAKKTSRQNRKNIPAELRVIPIFSPGNIRPKDSLLEKLLQALQQSHLSLQPGDILVVKHKIISKAEGRVVKLASITPSSSSRSWARRYNLDARVTELALAESKSVIRRKRGVLITETHHGFICANSGVDISNVDGGEHALLLPGNPDRSAAKLHGELKKHLGLKIPVIISDSFGRPWREGLTETAIGVAGMRALHDYRNQLDSYGYPLRITMEAVADELACAAGLVCGKLNGTPAAIVRGYCYQPWPGSARDLLRSKATDLFR
jgi:coenzyme F420-0:L-glutamate ligase / coenzyme F420-1:gamma-L-glutamate ligase